MVDMWNLKIWRFTKTLYPNDFAAFGLAACGNMEKHPEEGTFHIDRSTKQSTESQEWTV
jgi:hypothetical protein